MNEEFLAVIKLISGEEIVSIVSPHIEDEQKFLILLNPIKLTRTLLKDNLYGYKIEPWIKLTSEDLFMLKESSILTVVELFDKEIISLYTRYIKNLSQPDSNLYSLNRREGYVANVKEFRQRLEQIYNSNKPI